MESKINTIGLTIWGYKQGCKVLASQGVNFQSEEVKDRLKDISAFLRIHTPRADFYMLQFTQNYKIYTQYRSSREVNGQTGVYIAISLYIPHHLQWRGVRQVLNLLMDMYFAEHINYDDNTPLMNEKEDIFPYFNLLRGYEKQLTDDPEAKPCTLHLPYSPKVFPYADIYEVDKYFNMPYRPEFANLQEAVFLRKEFVDDPRAYSIDFLFPEYATVKNSTSTQATASGTSRFLLADSNIKVLAFMKNGKDVSATYANEIFSDDDAIELLLEKSRYQQMFSFRDTLKKGIKKGYIKRVQDNYALDAIPFADKEFKVYVETPQREFEKYLTFLSLESSNFKAKQYSDSKGRYFMLKGEEAHNIFNLSYNGIVFKSNYMVDDRVAISIPFEKYHFTIVSHKSVPIALKINGIVFSKSLRSDSPIEIVLPENLYHFEFENLESQRVISITKSGEVNFDAANNNSQQMIASESPKMANTKQLAVIGDDIEEDDEEVVASTAHKSRFYPLKIASVIIFALALVGIGYWFVFPMLKDPVKAYVAFSSDSKIKNIHFLTKIDEHTYEIDSSYIRLKKTFPNDTKVIINFAEEGTDTLALSKMQLNSLAEMVSRGAKDTLKIEVVSPARFFLSDVAHWKDTHADPKGALFLAEAKKRNYLTETLRPEYEKTVWENFLKNFDYSAYNSEQVDSLLSSYLTGGENELKAYQNDLRQIINQSREEEENNVVEEAPTRVETAVATTTPKPERKEPKPANKPAERTPVHETASTPAPTPSVERTEMPATTNAPKERDSKTIVRRNRNTPRPEATNAKLTNDFIADLKKFNSQSCSEEIVDRVKLNLKRLDAKDWSVVVYDFNQERKEIEERVNQYSSFFAALKKGGSIDAIKPAAFGGQANLIYFLKKGSNFDLVKNKPNLKTFADIRQAIIASGVDPRNIR